jgi:hypothetical protein
VLRVALFVITNMVAIPIFKFELEAELFDYLNCSFITADMAL